MRALQPCPRRGWSVWGSGDGDPAVALRGSCVEVLVRAGKGWQGSGWRGQAVFRQAASDAEAVMSQGGSLLHDML